jgi:hypothetical protein
VDNQTAGPLGKNNEIRGGTCEMLRKYFSFCNRSRSHSKWL